MKKRFLALVLAGSMLAALAGCGGAASSAPQSQEAPASSQAASSQAALAESEAPSSEPVEIDLNATAGAVGGGWYSTFAAFSEFITDKEPGITFKVSPGTGIANSATIGNGQFDVGWVYPPMTLLACNGETPYEEKVDGIRIVATGLSPQVIEVSALADVAADSLEEIFQEKKGIRFLTPNKGSTTPALFFDIVCKYYNASEEDIKSWGGSVTYTPYSDWSQLAQDKHIDVMFNQIALPSNVLQEIMTARDVKLFGLPDDLRKYLVENYALSETTIPAGTYDFLTEDIKTVQMASGLGANVDVPDEVVYRMLEIIDANIDEFKAIHPSWAGFDIKTAWQNAGAPLHPGAEKFYKDKGYMQ